MPLGEGRERVVPEEDQDDAETNAARKEGEGQPKEEEEDGQDEVQSTPSKRRKLSAASSTSALDAPAKSSDHSAGRTSKAPGSSKRGRKKAEPVVEEQEEKEQEEKAEEVKGPEEKDEGNSVEKDTGVGAVETPTSKPSIADRLAQLKQLKARLSQSTKDNRADVIAEDAKRKTNPRDELRFQRKKAEAEKLLARKDAEDNGEDYRRLQYWNYSAEDAARWEKAQEKKAKRANNAFTDYNQVAHKKYKKLIGELKPNVDAYNDAKAAIRSLEGSGEAGSDAFSEMLYRDANTLSYGVAGAAVSKEAAERLAQWQKDQSAITKSRRRQHNEDEDITYINERNARFNKKISRAYDKATKEIRDNLERGTAL